VLIFFAGVDIGSTMTKVVIIDADDTICSVIIGPTGPEHRHQANEVMRAALDNMQLPFERIEYCVATGYGRINVPFADRQITELTCHARGVAHSFPAVRTAIDIGGQDAKGLKIKDGKLIDFVMNDKCAAGTGRFLEVLSEKLGIAVEDLGSMSMKAQQKVTISSTCTIFAEQEMISHLSEGTSVEDIIAGLHDAIASRVVRMVKRLKIEPDVVLTGGVAKNIGVVHAVQETIGLEIHVPENPLISGALGAALLGKETFLQAQERNETLERKKRQLEDTVTFYT
jgi:predicted CoA-substrate-specific enzyme activase